jgi:hypothetical protein
MSIPIIIRIKGLYSMSAQKRASVLECLESEYRRASDKGMPLVVGPNCEVVWPVEEWEHRFEIVGSFDDIQDTTRRLEANGWQVCGVAPSYGDDRLVVFKRPAREGNDGSTP